MALSWDELSSDHKIVFLLESLVARKKNQQTPMACRLCDQIFLDDKKLVNHFQSHFHRDGTLNPRSLVGSNVSLENLPKFFPSSSKNGQSLLVMNVSKSTANENLGPHKQHDISIKSSSLSPGNYVVPTVSQDCVQLRDLQSFRTAIAHGTFASQPNQSSTFHSRSASKSAGPQTCNYSMSTEIQVTLTSYTKPYIMQLDHPIEEMMGDHSSVGGSSDSDVMDLTLKL